MSTKASLASRTTPMPTHARLQSEDLSFDKLLGEPWCIGLALVLTASIVVIPFLWLGTPVGHDFHFHLTSWREVARQWHEGIWYPRWAAGAQYGFGEPRFIFYPPASWALGATLGLILPWNMVPGAFVWLAVILAGVSMLWLAREYLMPYEATLAAVLYTANPYTLVMIYKRSSYAELLAGAILPLIVLFAIRLDQKGSGTVLPLALSFAGVWLTDPPAAVIGSYSLALILATLATVRRRPKIILLGAAAIALGLGLAAFYIGPAAREQNWVNITDALPPYLKPTNNFLFRPRETPYANLNLKISFLALAEIILAVGASIIAFRQVRPGRREMWCALVVLLLASILLMLPVSTIAWLYLPKLKFVQLPWRWLLVLNLTLAVLVVPAIMRFQRRRVAWLLIGFTLPAAILAIALRVEKMPSVSAQIQSAFAEGKGYMGTVEYVPRGFQRRFFSPNISEVTVAKTVPATASAGNAQDTDDRGVQIEVQHWGTETKSIRVNAMRPALLSVRLANYPAWVVKLNGEIIQPHSRESSGEMLVEVSSGHSEIELRFARTADRTISGAISAMTAVLLVLLTLGQRVSLRSPRELAESRFESMDKVKR